MDEIILEFKQESQDLVKQLIAILEEAEDDFSKVGSLETYGQVVDRIMGGASTICAQDPGLKTMEAIAKYAQLCKAIGYKGSQIQGNENLFCVTVGLLLDGTEQLEKMVDGVSEEEDKSLDDFMTQHFLERLVWLADQFDDSYRSSLKIDAEEEKGGGDTASSQAEVDALIAHFQS